MASILFLHGAGHAGWCWHERFTGWFEARGYTVAAPDLPHHGDLDHHGIKTTPLSAYVDAVGSTAAGLMPPLILVGHSMGGFIVQKYLERANAQLGILLASAPPAGPRGMVRRMATRRPVAVLGAEHDWLVAPRKDLTTTARAYHTTAQTLPGGHNMMLDTAWEQAAVAIQTAIAKQLAPR